MQINYMLILIATSIQFILGALWYSPLIFGTWWMQIMEVTNHPKEELQRAQREMAPFYGLQFLLTVVSTFVLAMFLASLPVESNIYGIAGFIWIGFIVPTQIGGVIWANTKKKFWLKQIFVMVSYQLVSILLGTFILSL